MPHMHSGTRPTHEQGMGPGGEFGVSHQVSSPYGSHELLGSVCWYLRSQRKMTESDFERLFGTASVP